MKSVDLSVEEMLTRWLAPPTRAMPPIGAPVSRHWRTTRAGLAKHLVDAIGERSVEALGISDIWAVQSWCRGRGLSAETTNKCTHHVLPACLRDFEAAGLIPAGTKIRAMHGAKRLRADAEQPCAALTIEERDRFVHAFRHTPGQHLVPFLFYTGLRVGEAAGLRQRDIDWHRRTLRVMRSRRGGELSATKSRRSQRVIPLAGGALASIAPLRNDAAPEAFLFRSPEGGDIDVDNFRKRWWVPTVRRLKMRPIRIHDARHTFATLALEAGVPIAKVATYLGDKIRTVEERYAHVIAAEDWDQALSVPGLRVVRKAG